ncbi:MAG: UDP-N-acetylglucosamine 4,6-dehydratase (inverting) [Alphaproteobacteria bacterium]|nr:UDP-N-acetylglucosamine 4,6-dehydratase (inverting) [Alphaproteobacteria bacterium]
MTIMRSFDGPLPDLDGARVLVTGGTGSFGQAFVQRVLDLYPTALVIVFSRDEQKQYQMEARLDPAQRERVRFFLGDVRDAERLELAMHNVSTVVHAAAQKHVSLAEYNPFECIKTNVHGAENVANAARRAGVSRVVALSTDKAANPINIYGASKLASDKIFIAANALSGAAGARYAVVRYGNVIGSRGSVIPFFKRLAAAGAAEVPITDARMTRFVITLEQGVAFVLSALAEMKGGEIFVPKIPSVRVVDLARLIAPDAERKIVGVRPGEKLHEMMISEDDARMVTELDDRYIINPSFSPWTAEPEKLVRGTPVAEGFSYRSDANPEWLDDAAMRGLIEAAPVDPSH